MSKKLNIFISGQKYFGELVLSMCINQGYNVIGVCCPAGDKYIGKTALIHNIPVITAGTLNEKTMPGGADIGITAHSFDYIGVGTRNKPKYGWIGYHPSLLPRHRGRSSIEWAIKMRDFATGGSVFWLNAGIDRGDIAHQELIFIDPALYGLEVKRAARLLWEHHLQDIGLSLIKKTLSEVSSGIITKKPQDKRFSTFEPSIDAKDIFRPDMLMLEAKNNIITNE